MFTERQRWCLKTYFDHLGVRISDLMDRLPGASEENLSGNLYEEVAVHSREGFYHHLDDCLTDEGYGSKTIRMAIHRFDRPAETRYGADFGLIVSYQDDAFEWEKAVLVQAKRLFRSRGKFTKNSRYKSLISLNQAKNLVRITSSSYFVLYNPRTVWRKGQTIPAGICMVPAGLIASYKGERKPYFYELHPHFLPFPDFMVDGLIATPMGDASERVIRIAAGEDPRVPVRYTWKISIAPRTQEL